MRRGNAQVERGGKSTGSKGRIRAEWRALRMIWGDPCIHGQMGEKREGGGVRNGGERGEVGQSERRIRCVS